MQCNALFHAIKTDDITQVVKLISSGADLKCADCIGNTVLHYIRCLEVAQILIDAGANVNAVNDYGDTPLHRVCDCEDDWTNYKALIASGEIVVHYAQNTYIAKLLLERGANINAINYCGDTPLHRACEHSNASIVRLLLTSGAYVNVQNGFGFAPLHRACECAVKISVVRLLLKHGAETNVIADGFCWKKICPLYYARLNSSRKIVNLLLEKWN